jgi:hypothetical protein
MPNPSLSPDDSDPPPEEASFHAFLTVGRWEYDRREAKMWRKSMDERLKKLERRVLLVGLALAAISGGLHDLPWEKIVGALAGP